MEAKTGKPGAGRAVVLSSELSRWCHRLATQTTMHTFVLYRYPTNQYSQRAFSDGLT